MNTSQRGIDERAFEFACQVIAFIRTVTPEPGIRRLVDQLVDAAGSIGANRQEGAGSSSRKEFVRFNEIALRSAKESLFWLRVCQHAGLGDRERCMRLLDEGAQIARILGAIIVKVRKTP